MPSKLVKAAARALGYSIAEYRPEHDETVRLVRLLEARGIALVLDVGANRGQFGKKLFKGGYSSALVSFEPLSEAHALLRQAAAKRPHWTVYRRCALGSQTGRCRINIAANSQSSSILPMLERHIEAAPGSHYTGAEEAELVTLDRVLADDYPGQAPVGLKLDVQGYEREVLAGLVAERQRVKLIYTELSLTPLYQGGPGFPELANVLIGEGFRCVSLAPNFIDARTYEMLEANAIFVRD
jgi:FkbM family methyltransferase